MKHHCHCGFRDHLKRFRAKKLGLAGGIFLVLHLLFHVAECLILPSILVGLGGHLAEEPAVATDGESSIVEENPEVNLPAIQHCNLSTHTDIPVYDVGFYQIRL